MQAHPGLPRGKWHENGQDASCVGLVAALEDFSPPNRSFWRFSGTGWYDLGLIDATPTRLRMSAPADFLRMRLHAECFYLARLREVNMVRAHMSGVYIILACDSGFLTTLAFWLRSSVVSVLNSLTTIMKAPPSLLVI